MGRKKKSYKDERKMTLVCTKCQNIYKECEHPYSLAAWVALTEKELNHYKQTGLIPDVTSELFSTGEKVNPIPLKFPPEHDFKID